MHTDPSTVVDLDGPRGLPGLGNLLGFARGGTPHRALYRWHERYGPTYRMRLPGVTAVVTSAPAIIRTVLRDRPEMFRRGQFVSDLIDELGGYGLFSAEGEDWRRLRRVATRGLSTRYLRQSFGTILRSAGRLTDRWGAAAARGERIDALEDLTRYTLEVAVGVTMNHDLGASGGADGDLRLPLVFETLRRRLNSPVPYWRYVRLPADRRADAAIAQARALILDRYAEARDLMAAGGEPHDYLTALAKADGDGEDPLGEDDVVGSVLTMIVAGEEPTAAAAAWALHYLATHPEAQQRVRAETAAVFGPDGAPGDFSMLARLPFAEAVVHEAIRLRPPSPFVIMQPLADTTVGDGDTRLHLERGTPIFVLQTYGSATDAARYPEPGAFRPQRWLAPNPDAESNAQPYVPFGSGPRFCPGRQLGLLEATLIVAMTCHAYTIEPDSSAGPVGERETFALLPTNLGVRLRPAPREPASAGPLPSGPAAGPSPDGNPL
ncbi:cytochrome P450 [Actinoplanes sp. NPDC089786]|uniref:cytochrome P450 n=1 Tax=Actinoplanes sp. NPDC089786 TaxID=3155185 RepID=UPI00341D928F